MQRTNFPLGINKSVYLFIILFTTSSLVNCFSEVSEQSVLLKLEKIQINVFILFKYYKLSVQHPHVLNYKFTTS